MIPIKNKRKNLEMTIEEMRKFASAYIEKYAPSKQQLKTYLLKKYLKSHISSIKKKDVTDLINLVTEDLEKAKFINDKLTDPIYGIEVYFSCGISSSSPGMISSVPSVILLPIKAPRAPF